MTNEEVMVELKSTLRYIANSRRATNPESTEGHGWTA